jgi:hypothetical protein
MLWLRLSRALGQVSDPASSSPTPTIGATGSQSWMTCRTPAPALWRCAKSWQRLNMKPNEVIA